MYRTLEISSADICVAFFPEWGSWIFRIFDFFFQDSGIGVKNWKFQKTFSKIQCRPKFQKIVLEFKISWNCMIHAAWIHFYGNIFIIFKFLQLSIFSKEFWQFFRLRLRFQTQGRSRSFIGGSSLIHWIIDSDVDDHLNYFGRENNSYRHQVAVDLAQTFSAGSVVVSVSFIGLMIFAPRGALQSKLIIEVERL